MLDKKLAFWKCSSYSLFLVPFQIIEALDTKQRVSSRILRLLPEDGLKLLQMSEKRACIRTIISVDFCESIKVDLWLSRKNTF